MLGEVTLRLPHATLLLMAGETWDTGPDTVRLCRHDDSVLVFGDPADADGLTWIPPRERPGPPG